MAPSGLCREGALRGRARPFPSVLFPPPSWRPCPATAASSAASSAGPRPGPSRPAGLRGGSSAARPSRSWAPGGPRQRVRAAGSGDCYYYSEARAAGSACLPRPQPCSPQPLLSLNSLLPLTRAFSFLPPFPECPNIAGRWLCSPCICAGLSGEEVIGDAGL